MACFRGAGQSIAAGMLLLCASAHGTQYWELSPASDPAVAIGTYTTVGGQTSPDGVNFTLKDNSADKPLALTLIATAPGSPLHLSAFKEDGESFLDRDTDATGLLTVRFRTADTMNFKVTGAVGSAYQLALWRGPAIALPQPDGVVAMDAVTGNAESAGKLLPRIAGDAPTTPASPQANPASVAANAPVSAGASGSNSLIYVLLAGIFGALILIAFLIHRGQKTRGRP